MPSNLESPGRPSSTNQGGLQATTNVPYVDWTADVQPWLDQAQCRYEGRPDDWFEDGATEYSRAVRNEAIATCHRCPVEALCLERQLKLEAGGGEVWGIVGGMTADQRRKIRAKTRKVKQQEPVHCGTTAGYYRHKKNKTVKCQPCWDAKAEQERGRRVA